MVLVVEFVVVVLGVGLVCGTYLRMHILRDVPSCLLRERETQKECETSCH